MGAFVVAATFSAMTLAVLAIICVVASVVMSVKAKSELRSWHQSMGEYFPIGDEMQKRQDTLKLIGNVLLVLGAVMAGLSWLL